MLPTAARRHRIDRIPAQDVLPFPTLASPSDDAADRRSFLTTPPPVGAAPTSRHQCLRHTVQELAYHLGLR
ncbi:hypothetical protein E2562_022765 [Oryza meyeriana var. granulata]|uniref:Uncharacterized protein n=1 Tax=Oryza meyeriana var. granulata TaxID=110450 RepID=A0A6G1FB92_9ORYZ|nr:hypothetical protein E2562_022765 [Oryza meyeriana var. granulata]